MSSAAAVSLGNLGSSLRRPASNGRASRSAGRASAPRTMASSAPQRPAPAMGAAALGIISVSGLIASTAVGLPPLHVPTSAAGLAIVALQCLNLASFANERANPMAYSKFAQGRADATIPSRAGMLIIYTPALLVATAAAAAALLSAEGPFTGARVAVVAGMLVLHFAKRVFEVLYVHKYSGNTSSACYAIGAIYSLIALLLCVQTSNVPAAVYEASASHVALPLALLLFGIGQAGNGYHHVLLARLRRAPGAAEDDRGTQRSPAAKAAYSIPSGGLFKYCAAPHYLFEVVAWLGIALAAQQLNALLAAAGMASYLAGRAVANSAWYEAKFPEEYAALKRTHMVPFIF